MLDHHERVDGSGVPDALTCRDDAMGGTATNCMLELAWADGCSVPTRTERRVSASTVSIPAVRPGSGAVVRRGLHKIAVYRDATGTLHRHSAVCPHLGCIVRWNPNERTWDCPCHGSRYDRLGIKADGAQYGPAVVDGHFEQEGNVWTDGKALVL